jgi:hypothetical protein
MTGQNEDFSRVRIDKALEFSGWNLLDPQQLVFEQHTQTAAIEPVLPNYSQYIFS